MIRVLLADDHLVVRMGLSAVISFERDMTVVAEASTGQEAVNLAQQHHPDVVVMDLMMPHMDGIEATRAILSKNPSAKILIITSYGASTELCSAIDAGAIGAIVKTSTQPQIISAIRATANGQRVVSPEIEYTLKSNEYRPQLSSRQIEILTLVSKGLTNQEIANMLGISIDTIKDHLKTIFAHLGAATRAEAASVAIAFNLIPGP